MRYTVRLERQPQRTLDAATGVLLDRLLSALHILSDNPRPPGVKMLKGQRDHWRMRVGDWRIIYTIQDQELIVMVLRIAHRREVYR
jgi:mRNA interferase RelE/StbE